MQCHLDACVTSGRNVDTSVLSTPLVVVVVLCNVVHRLLVPPSVQFDACSAYSQLECVSCSSAVYALCSSVYRCATPTVPPFVHG
jgi:hypothetical protein